MGKELTFLSAGTVPGWGWGVWLPLGVCRAEEQGVGWSVSGVSTGKPAFATVHILVSRSRLARLWESDDLALPGLVSGGSQACASVARPPWDGGPLLVRVVVSDSRTDPVACVWPPPGGTCLLQPQPRELTRYGRGAS